MCKFARCYLLYYTYPYKNPLNPVLHIQDSNAALCYMLHTVNSRKVLLDALVEILIAYQYVSLLFYFVHIE
jgi:hypothetical protein